MSAGQPTGRSLDHGTAAARLLDAAEALFAGADLEHVSTRQITRAAGCNPGAINYHFGSKDGLLDAVLARRLGHLAHERAERIATLEQQADRPTPDELVAVITDPLVRLVRTDPTHGTSWVRLIARLWLTRRTIVTRRSRQTFDERALAGLARRTLDHLDPVSAALQWELAIDVLLMALGDPFSSFEDVAFEERARVARSSAVAMLQSC